MQIEGPPVRAIGAVGATLQLRAIATLDDGTRPDVTAEATWTVTNPNVLSVSSRGLVSALANGSSIVDAVYRGRAGTTSLTVAPEFGSRYPLTGVIVDRDTGSPLAGAYVLGTGADRQAFTDGNGFFDLGTAIRPTTLTVTVFGYADATQVVSSPLGPAHVTVGVASNGPYIERILDPETVSTVDGEPFLTWRISTRANSGMLDATVTSSCDYDGWVALRAESGGVTFQPTGFPCTPRLRFVPPGNEVRFTARTHYAPNVKLIVREPR
jgi:hypothetical protein